MHARASRNALWQRAVAVLGLKTTIPVAKFARRTLAARAFKNMTAISIQAVSGILILGNVLVNVVKDLVGCVTAIIHVKTRYHVGGTKVFSIV
jgi:hypothetical protein